jgi:hypothetical protein
MDQFRVPDEMATVSPVYTQTKILLLSEIGIANSGSR